MRRKKKVLGIAAILTAALLWIAMGGAGEEQRPQGAGESGGMAVHFLDVGQADCALVEADGHFLLIDAGNNDDADRIKAYLKEQGVEKLDYVIGTHPHEDHIGSLDMVIGTFDIGTLIMPSKAHTTKSFEDVVQAVEEEGLEVTAPRVGSVYPLGTAEFVIIAPNSDGYGDSRFVFAGDAEGEAERDICANGMELSADVYKVSHHGSRTGTSAGFLDAVEPRCAVISCGRGNDYGHPHKETLSRLEKAGVKVFRTDLQGTIVAVSDGKRITWSGEPVKAAGEDSARREANEDEGDG